MLCGVTLCCNAQTIRDSVPNKMAHVVHDTIINGTAYLYDVWPIKAQTIRNSVSNKMVFVAQDTIIEGTAYFYDDGHFSMSPIIDTTNEESTDYKFDLINKSVEKRTRTFTYNTDRIDTIKYIFDVYECEDLSDMNQPIWLISNILYKYSYIASVFGCTDSNCQLRFIIPMQEISFCSEYYDINVFFDDYDSSVCIKYKHATSKDTNGLTIDFCDSLKCDSRLYTTPIKRHYRKLISDKKIKTEIYADVNPYYIYIPNRSVLISPYDPERRFNSRNIEVLQNSLLGLVRQNDKQKKRITIE